MHLSRIDLQTVNSGAYTLRASNLTASLTIPPHNSGTATFHAWGRATGGHLASTEPVTLRATAYMTGSKSGVFFKMAQGNITPE